MKTLGLVMLCIGVALSASYGARLTSEIQGQMSAQGRARFLAEQEAAAFEAYCGARTEAGYAAGDGCPGGAEVEAAQDEPTEAPAEPTEAPTLESLIASGRARVAALRASSEAHSGDLLEAREAWLAAAEATVEPAAQAAVVTPPGPGERVASWFGTSGLMFLLGLALVLAGAVVGRKAVKLAAKEGEGGDGEGQAQDFGHLLDSLHDQIEAVASEMEAHGTPAEADFARIKESIETLQLEKFEPLIAARSRLQAKYGMGPFAEIFGPLSGAERKVNRTWSALVDMHWPEATASVKIAVEELDAAKQALDTAIKNAH